MIMSWRASKGEAADFYRKRDFLSSLTKYREAATILESSDIDNKNEELAKIYSNISLMNQLLSNESIEIESEMKYNEAAKDAALKSIQLDGNWSKGHLRLSQAKSRLEEDDEGLSSMIVYMRLASDKEKQSPAVLNHLKDLEYYTHRSVKQLSSSWHLVRFPDNVYCVDSKGAGDFTSLTACLEFLNFLNGNKDSGVSILVRPGTYTENLTISHMTLDIVGDCSVSIDEKNNFLQADPVVVLQNVEGKLISEVPKNLNTLRARECDLFMARLSLLENSSIKDTPGIIIVEGRAKLYQCSTRSLCNTDIILKDVHATISSCRSFNTDACIMSIGEKAVVKVENCHFKNVAHVAIEVTRNTKTMKVLNSKFVGSKMSSIATFSGSKKLIVRDCLFIENNTEDMQSDIHIEHCNAVIHNTTFENSKGIGIEMESGKGDFKDIVFKNCHVCFDIASSATISSCTIQDCLFGMYICNMFAGDLILKDNHMINCYHEIARYSESVEPVFLGDCRHKARTISVNMLLGDKFDKRRKENRLLEKHCKFCNASEGLLGHKFLVCGGCKLVSYCSPVCQKNDWKVHKPVCLKNKEFLDLYKQAKSTGCAKEALNKEMDNLAVPMYSHGCN